MPNDRKPLSQKQRHKVSTFLTDEHYVRLLEASVSVGASEYLRRLILQSLTASEKL